MKEKLPSAGVVISNVAGDVSNNVITGGDLSAHDIAVGAGTSKALDSEVPPDLEGLLREIEADLGQLALRNADVREISPDAAHQIRTAQALVGGMLATLTTGPVAKEGLAEITQDVDTLLGRLLKKGRALVSDAATISGSAVELVGSLEAIWEKVVRIGGWIAKG
jgi:hypothetical protein